MVAKWRQIIRAAVYVIKLCDIIWKYLLVDLMQYIRHQGTYTLSIIMKSQLMFLMISDANMLQENYLQLDTSTPEH